MIGENLMCMYQISLGINSNRILNIRSTVAKVMVKGQVSCVFECNFLCWHVVDEKG